MRGLSSRKTPLCASIGSAKQLLRKCARQKDRSRVAPSTTLPDQEHHVLAAFEACLHSFEIILAVNRLLVNLQNDIPAGQACVVAKRSGLYVLNHNPLAGGNIQTVCHLRCERMDCDAELALLWLRLLTAFFLVPKPRSKQLGAVGH